MVYVSSQNHVSRRILDVGGEPQPGNMAGNMDISSLLDPLLLEAARQIYRDYYEVHPDQVQRPIGVAIDRFNYRGQLIFNKKPILLPQECFIPINQIDTDL